MPVLKKLIKGSTIGIINPAFKNKIDDVNNPNLVFLKYQKMIDYLEGLGYKLKFGKTFTAEDGYLAGSDELRAQDIMDMFLDDEVDAIICMRGGYGCSRIVDKIDYNIIKKHPKIFCGFSDITVFLNSIYQETKIPTIHGLISLYLDATRDKDSLDDFWEMTTKDQLNRVLESPKSYTGCKTLVEGKASGVLVGGNLSLICALVGTPYEIDFTDKIVFIEDVEEEPYRLDRYFSTLRLSGALKKAKGFVFGYFTDCNPSDGRVKTQTYQDLLNEYIKDLGKPVIYDFCSGHSFPFVNLPIGVMVTMDANKRTIEIKEEIYATSPNKSL